MFEKDEYNGQGNRIATALFYVSFVVRRIIIILNMYDCICCLLKHFVTLFFSLYYID